MLHKLLSLYKPDLNIVTEDEKNGGKYNICGEETKNVKAHIKTHYMVKVSDAGYASNDMHCHCQSTLINISTYYIKIQHIFDVGYCYVLMQDSWDSPRATHAPFALPFV